MFDLTAALMDFYVATTKELRENQQRYNDYINSITELNTYLTETTAMVSNAQTAIASAQSLVGQIDFEIRSFGRAGRDQLIAKRQAAAAEIALLGAKLAEARTTFPLKQNELRQKQDGLQIVQKQLKQLTAREGEYVTRLVTDLDLYQDKPKAYHERLKTVDRSDHSGKSRCSGRAPAQWLLCARIARYRNSRKCGQGAAKTA